MSLRFGAALPSIEGVPLWINDSISDVELSGHPVLVVFWALSCSYCLQHMEDWQQWHSLEANGNFNVVAVHAPRTKSDKKADLEQLAKQLKLFVPCAIDSQRVLAARFQTDDIWPHYFLFNAAGKLRCRTAVWQLMETALHRHATSPT